VVAEDAVLTFILRTDLERSVGPILRSSLGAYLGWRLLKCALPPAVELAPEGGDVCGLLGYTFVAAPACSKGYRVFIVTVCDTNFTGLYYLRCDCS
jgi:hypothetical protein